MIETAIIIIFILGYLTITLEHRLGINKASIALLMAVFCWALNFIKVFPQDDLMLASLHGHLGDVSQIIFFLIGAMTIVELVDSYRGFKLVQELIRSNDKRILLASVSFATFFISAVLDNLTTSIIMVMILRRLISDNKERLIFASMVVISANAGGAWTPIGDVTTTMLWIGERVSSSGIMRNLFLPSLVSMVVPLLVISSLYVKGKASYEPLPDEAVPARDAQKVMALGVGALVFVPVLKSLTGLPPYMGILLGLGLMWLFTDLINQERHFLRVPHILTKIDISSALFFLGILLAVNALETAGILNHLAQWLDSHTQDKDIIVIFMGIISSIIDNVPLTAVLMGMYDLGRYPMDSKLWEMTAYCVGTGGSMLIIGSAAGVVVMGMEKIRFSWYLRKVSFPALLGYAAGILVLLLFYR